MSGYLAAVTHASRTAFIVGMEMVDSHAMVLSLMAVAMIASLVARLVSPPLYETIAERMLARLPHGVPPGPRNNAAFDIESHNKRQDNA